MARIVRFHKMGGPEVLQLDEVEISPPANQEVQIRVKALGLNRAEALKSDFSICIFSPYFF